MVRILLYYPPNAVFLRPGGPGPTPVVTGTTDPRHDAAVGRSFLKLGSGEAVARLIAFGVMALLARRLGADLFGSIALATAVFLYLACLTDCGIEMLGISDVSRQPGQIAHFLPPILTARAIVALLLMAGLTLLGLFVLPQPEGALIAAYAFALGAVAFATQWVYLGLEQAGRVALVRVGAEGLTALLVIVLVRGPEDVARAPLAQVIGQGAGAFVLLRLLPGGVAGLRARLDSGVLAPVLRRSWPLVLHALLGLMIFNSDFLFLRIFRDAASVGYYAVGYTLVSFFLNLGVSYSMGLLPVLARLRDTPADERRLHDDAMAQVFAGALPVAIGGCLLADRLIAGLFGEGYQPAASPLQILIWTVPLALFRSVGQTVLVAHDQSGHMLRTVAAAAALNLGLNLTMIPVWGTPGAAAATLLTEAVRTALVLWYSRRAGLPFTSVRRFWRSALAGAGLAAVVLATTAASWWSAVALGILAYGAALTLLGGLRLRRGALPELTV